MNGEGYIDSVSFTASDLSATTLVPSDSVVDRAERSFTAASELTESAPLSATEDDSLQRNESLRRRTKAEKESKQRESEAWKSYSLLCQDLKSISAQLNTGSSEDVAADYDAGAIAEIEHLLTKLYRVPFGVDESLSRCVVAIESVLLEVDWAPRHASFAKSVFAFLAARSYVDGSTVSQVYDIIREYGLDEFRGILS